MGKKMFKWWKATLFQDLLDNFSCPCAGKAGQKPNLTKSEGKLRIFKVTEGSWLKDSGYSFCWPLKGFLRTVSQWHLLEGALLQGIRPRATQTHVIFPRDVEDECLGNAGAVITYCASPSTFPVTNYLRGADSESERSVHCPATECSLECRFQ